jgi:hypothetical protein
MTMARPVSLQHVRADWLRVQSEVAYVRMMVSAHRLMTTLREQDERKFNPYHDDAGRFTTSDGVGSGGAGTNSGSKPNRSGDVQIALADPRVTAALTLLTLLYGQEQTDETPYIQFNARAFEPGADSESPALQVGSLTREETDASCPRNGQVQSLTDEAKAKIEQEGNYLGATAKGTRIHGALKRSIDALADDNFRAEVSVIKSEAAGYGKRNSVRVDVFENVGDGTVCVYDIKTGKSILTGPRMQEIANNVHSYYPGTLKVVVIETRPK